MCIPSHGVHISINKLHGCGSAGQRGPGSAWTRYSQSWENETFTAGILIWTPWLGQQGIDWVKHPSKADSTKGSAAWLRSTECIPERPKYVSSLMPRVTTPWHRRQICTDGKDVGICAHNSLFCLITGSKWEGGGMESCKLTFYNYIKITTLKYSVQLFISLVPIIL